MKIIYKYVQGYKLKDYDPNDNIEHLYLNHAKQYLAA